MHLVSEGATQHGVDGLNAVELPVDQRVAVRITFQVESRHELQVPDTLVD